MARSLSCAEALAEKLTCLGLHGSAATRNARVGDSACFNNAGSVNKDACQGTTVCAQNTGAIGTNACNGDQACANNPGPIAAGTCNGDPVGGVGICEVPVCLTSSC